MEVIVLTAWPFEELGILRKITITLVIPRRKAVLPSGGDDFI